MTNIQVMKMGGIILCILWGILFYMLFTCTPSWERNEDDYNRHREARLIVECASQGIDIEKCEELFKDKRED